MEHALACMIGQALLLVDNKSIFKEKIGMDKRKQTSLEGAQNLQLL